MKMKCFKIRTVNSAQKYGLCCRDLKELRRKACAKLQLPLKKSRVCLAEDGTELSEEYLLSLPDHTDLVLLTPGQTWEGNVKHLLNQLYTRQPEIIEAVREIQTDGQAAEMRTICQNIIQNLDSHFKAEKRKDDKSWFKGIDERFKNKSSYMRDCCRRRIRSYLNEVRCFEVDSAVEDEYEELVRTMHNALTNVDFNGSYFDRSDAEDARLCTDEGWFTCQGAFDKNDCRSNHSINPYSNRESRIVFSTWNLDHVIEKKRAILPGLTRALKDRKGRQINWEYFFDLLFTTENLKLVHISCHKKTAHKLECNEKKIYH
ncbi:DNA fragmentation factor subunit beta [Anomaloglossus baeobatrachus]|uniref:DNA fragmentation factor subunit beta n=1 Tax=Anomaloglossus baeobatrachus TaxID=238106 RepID=UPI003F505A1B